MGPPPGSNQALNVLRVTLHALPLLNYHASGERSGLRALQHHEQTRFGGIAACSTPPSTDMCNFFAPRNVTVPRTPSQQTPVPPKQTVDKDGATRVRQGCNKELKAPACPRCVNYPMTAYQLPNHYNRTPPSFLLCTCETCPWFPCCCSVSN